MNIYVIAVFILIYKIYSIVNTSFCNNTFLAG